MFIRSWSCVVDSGKKTVENMSMEHYGFKPVIKQPQLTKEEADVLANTMVVTCILMQELEFWRYSAAVKTIDTLCTAVSVMYALMQAFHIDGQRVQRCACALRGHNLRDFVSVIRCPDNSDTTLKERVRANRQKLRVYLLLLVRSLQALVKSCPVNQEFDAYTKQQQQILDLGDE